MYMVNTKYFIVTFFFSSYKYTPCAYIDNSMRVNSCNYIKTIAYTDNDNK